MGGKCREGYHKEWWIKNKDKVRDKRRVYSLMRNFGITAEQYEALLSAQNGVCAICQLPERATTRQRLCVDHCHSTGRIRGLLCTTCNKAIGCLKDNPELLKRAVSYLA